MLVPLSPVPISPTFQEHAKNLQRQIVNTEKLSFLYKNTAHKMVMALTPVVHLE